MNEQCNVPFYYYDKECNKTECNSKEDRENFLSIVSNDETKLYTIAAPLEWHNRILPEKLHDNYIEENLYYMVKDRVNEYYIAVPKEWDELTDEIDDELWHKLAEE